MNLVEEKLPLEYPPREMGRIYAKRFLLFAGVIGLNCLWLILLLFARSYPIPFIVAAWMALLVFACWWPSRGATLAKSGREHVDTGPLSASDSDALAAAMVGLVALLRTDSRGSAEAGTERLSGRIGPFELHKLLEETDRFHREIMGAYFQRRASQDPVSAKKEKWLGLAQIAADISGSVRATMDTMPGEYLSAKVGYEYTAGSPETSVLSFTLYPPKRTERAVIGQITIHRRVGPWDAQFLRTFESVSHVRKDLRLFDELDRQGHALMLFVGYLRGAILAYELLAQWQSSTVPECGNLASVRNAMKNLSDGLRVERLSSADDFRTR